MTENVIYRYDPDGHPTVGYHAIPSLCAGGASTLGEARASYRGSLARLLNCTRQGLPSVVEHLEGAVAGMWVRTRIGAVHRDPVSDRMFLQILLSPGDAQDELRGALESATRRGAAPVVLIVEPDDTFGSVLDQMTPRDTFVVTFCGSDNTVGWIVAYGPEAEGREGISLARDDAELRATTVEALTRDVTAAGGRAVRLPHYSFALAC
jgi:hypothetical protein